MVLIQIGAMKGREVPVRWAMARLMKMATSMTAIRMKGRERDFRTRAIMRKMATMEMELTTWKSLAMSLIISLVAGASPIRRLLSLYLLMVLLISSAWVLAALVAFLYSEPTSMSCQLSPLRISVTESGRISVGIRSPRRLSRPRTYLMPGRFWRSEDIWRILSEEVSVGIRRMSVEPAWKSCSSFVSAMTYSMSLGREPPIS